MDVARDRDVRAVTGYVRRAHPFKGHGDRRFVRELLTAVLCLSQAHDLPVRVDAAGHPGLADVPEALSSILDPCLDGQQDVPISRPRLRSGARYTYIDCANLQRLCRDGVATSRDGA